MKRKIFLYQELKNNKILTIKDKEVIKRIINVYRLKIGDQLIFIGKDLFEGYFLFKDKNHHSLTFEFLKPVLRKITPKRNITFYLSFLKKQSFEFILSKSFELGIKKIVPVKTERSTWSTKQISERWLKIIYKSLEISEWNYLPEILPPIELINLPSHIYVLDQKGTPINKIKMSNDISIFLGPEGGLSDREIEILKNKKSKFISLLPVNLKAETAFLVCASLLNIC
jgi:16S rRNA (uracil1498-N3)-methyltransferase